MDQSGFSAMSSGEEFHKLASNGRAQINWGYIFDSGHRQHTEAFVLTSK